MTSRIIYSWIALLVFSCTAWGKANPYTVPLRFDVLGNGVEMPPLEFEYDASQSSSNSLLLGGRMRIDGRTFFAALLPLGRLDQDLSSKLTDAQKADWVFVLSWPEFLFDEATLEVVSKTGRVLWSQDIKESHLSNWDKQLNRWRNAIGKSVKRETVDKKVLFRTNYGFTNAKSAAPLFFQLNEWVKFCLMKKDDVGQSRLCTAYYEIAQKEKGPEMRALLLSPQPPRVILNNEEAPIQGIVPIESDKPVQFYAELATGVSYEFFSVPERFRLVEMVALKQPGKARLMAEGRTPLQPSRRIYAEVKPSYLTKLFHWEQTIGDFREFWESDIQLSEPFILIRGNAGGVFKQKFEITKLPKEDDRVFLHEDTVQGTYVDDVKVYGVKQKNQIVKSDSLSVEQGGNKENPNEFTWHFGAAQRGVYNKSYLNIESGQDTFRGFREIYKGYPRELSTRLTAILGSGGNLTAMGEVAFNYWFEDLMGWTHYYLARQRWGVSAKMFMSITDVKLKSVSSKLSQNTAELRYRLTPGLWGRDETWGFLLGFQNVVYEQFNANFLGGGVFWARSMPRVFDDIFNILPMMRYPKWVDWEIIYYPVSMKANYKPTGGGILALNFHGKVMWSERWFGEAGFGMKYFGFNRTFYDENNQFTRNNLRFAAVYATMGLGMNF